ncbi:trypsin-like peptidase domain-containing protein [Candidatus Woesebacteria bacterium]|nr:trypsin-like peptidase domain-containing protein [Candidatus Woesebacteria bacterium]
MTRPENFPADNLLLTKDSCGYAMALILRAHIVTAGHVASGFPTYHVPFLDQMTDTPLQLTAGRDLAISTVETVSRGFEKIAPPSLDQCLTIVGFHGFEHVAFEINVRVIEIHPNGKVIVEWLSGTEALVGMSGSPAITEQDEVVGILVSDVEGTNGKQLVIESVSDLKF